MMAEEITGFVLVVVGVFAAGLFGNWGWEPHWLVAALSVALLGYLIPARCGHDR